MALTKSISRSTEVVRFLIIVGVMILIAAGQLFIVGRFESVVIGLPLWVWMQLGFIVILLGLAWIATSLVMPDEEV